MGSKIPQTISHNHIKIKGQKHENTNQFTLGHQLVHQTQQHRTYNCKRRIIIQ